MCKLGWRLKKWEAHPVRSHRIGWGAQPQPQPQPQMERWNSRLRHASVEHKPMPQRQQELRRPPRETRLRRREEAALVWAKAQGRLEPPAKESAARHQRGRQR
jgi:hypothetical protein